MFIFMLTLACALQQISHLLLMSRREIMCRVKPQGGGFSKVRGLGQSDN